MDVGKVILMGSISIAGAVVEKILINFGKTNEAEYVKIGTIATVGVTALLCVKDIFDVVRGL